MTAMVTKLAGEDGEAHNVTSHSGLYINVCVRACVLVCIECVLVLVCLCVQAFFGLCVCMCTSVCICVHARVGLYRHVLYARVRAFVHVLSLSIYVHVAN